MKNFDGMSWVAGPETPTDVYVTRVFNYGTLEEWRQMKKRLSLLEPFHHAENLYGKFEAGLRGRCSGARR
ncbi:MAG: hypothetical protein KCHDKBKB_00914 [Elusimicrobia bacterium]|nr:hypothetical protein [Elusimicrobiota bacterium]